MKPLRDNSRTQVVVFETQAGSFLPLVMGGVEGGEVLMVKIISRLKSREEIISVFL